MLLTKHQSCLVFHPIVFAFHLSSVRFLRLVTVKVKHIMCASEELAVQVLQDNIRIEGVDNKTCITSPAVSLITYNNKGLSLGEYKLS